MGDINEKKKSQNCNNLFLERDVYFCLNEDLFNLFSLPSEPI